VRATYKAPNQADTALKGDLSASFVVSDPRFQVNFVHPETVRSGEEYTAFAFITNTSATAQTVRIDPGQIPVCGVGSSWSDFNICFPQPMDPVEATIERGKTITVPYHLKSRVTAASSPRPERATTTSKSAFRSRWASAPAAFHFRRPRC